MHASFSFHHSNLQLAYTTQAWKLKFKILCHASKHMKYTFKCTIQVHELAPPTSVLKILIDSFPLSYLSPYVKFSPFVVFSPSQYTNIFCFSHILISLLFLPLSFISLFLSPFVINDHKGLKGRQVEIINVNQWGEDYISKLGSNQNICQRYLTRFDPRTSFFTPPNKGYLVPC